MVQIPQYLSTDPQVLIQVLSVRIFPSNIPLVKGAEVQGGC